MIRSGRASSRPEPPGRAVSRRSPTGRVALARAGPPTWGIDEPDNRGDKMTADLYTENSRAADERPWFLEAQLQATE